MKSFLSFIVIINKELKIALRNCVDLLLPLLSSFIIVSLFGFMLSNEVNALVQLGPGIIWVSFLMALLLAMDSMFKRDYDDGSLEQLLLSHHPLTVLITAKIISHWLVTVIPLILLSPLFAVMMHLSINSYIVLLVSLLLGTPILILLGAVMVALTLSLQNRALLLVLLLLPLYIPILLLGSSASIAININLSPSVPLEILAAILALAACTLPWVTTQALKIGATAQ